MNIGACKDKIAEIEGVLREYDNKFESMGLNHGLLGLSAFYYYCYIYSNEEKYLADISNYITLSFNGLGSHYTGFSSVKDIIEIGTYLHFLKRKNILEDNINEYLEDADSIVIAFLNEQIVKKNIDPVSGTIKAGYYLLNRLETKEVAAEIEKIIVHLHQEAKYDVERKEVYWYNNFRDENIQELELGFTHGLAGIVNFLLSAYEKGILQGQCNQLITSAINFLIKCKAPNGVNLFPFEVLENTTLYYQNLCYGDIGIGFVFMRAGMLLERNDFLVQGIEIIENSARFKDEDEEYIKDANLLYGASGLFSFFEDINKHIGSETIQQASDYWFQKMTTFNKHETPWLGYKSNFNNHLVSTQLCFAEGISGIGISFMAKELLMDKDYLFFLNYSI